VPLRSRLERLDEFQQRHRLTAFPVAVVKKFGDDRGGQLAALITYYGFLALFPLLLVLVTTLAFFLHDNAQLRADLLDSALADFPVIGAQLRKNVHALGGNGLGLVVGVAALIWGSLGVAQAAQHAMAEVWSVPVRDRPSFLPRIGRALLLIGVIGLSVVVTTVLAALATLLPDSPAIVVLTTLLTIALNIGLYLLAFRILTPEQVPTRSLRVGAVVGGIAWTALQALGGWLVARQLRHTSELYGFFGIVLGLLFFLFLAAQLVVYAAEINVVLGRKLYPRSLVTPPLTDADEHALREKAEAEARVPEERVDVRFGASDSGSSPS
jgi:YihY family inner membrane protein